MQLEGYSLPALSKPYTSLFSSIEDEYNLPRYILTRIAQQETGGKFNFNAINRSSGAKGMFQLTSITIKELKNNGLDVNPYNVDQAAQGAAFYLDLIRRRYGFGNNWQLILAGYNRGPVAVAKAYKTYIKTRKPMPLPRETINYYSSIMRDLNLGYA